MESRDILGHWLNNAYAMEQALLPVLRNHAGDTEEYPEIHALITRHIDETERHADNVRACLEILGKSPSAVKNMTAKVGGFMQGVSTEMHRDELIKNALADYAAEQFEVASYRALILAATQLGEHEIVGRLEENLRDDERMARELEEGIPEIVGEVLAELLPEEALSFGEQVEEED